MIDNLYEHVWKKDKNLKYYKYIIYIQIFRSSLFRVNDPYRKFIRSIGEILGALAVSSCSINQICPICAG